MTETNPPTFNFSGINYNSQFWTKPSSSLSQSTADQRYLQRIGVPTSIASLTTFTGQIKKPTPLLTDNSTEVATTAYVQGQGYTTLTAIQNNNNAWTGTNSFSATTTFTGNISANSLTITPTQLSFLNNVSAGKIGQSQITNGYVDLSSAQTSIGGNKTFTSTVTFSNTIQGNINAVLVNTFSGLYTTYYFMFSNYNTAGGTNIWVPSGSTFNYNTSTNLLTVPNIISALGSSTASTQTSTDNSTKIATTAFVKNQGYTTLSAVQANTNTFSVNQTFQGGIDASATQTITFGSNSPTMQGTNITNIPDGALSSNVALLNASNTFTANQTFQNNITASATQTINFGSNAPTMSASNLLAGSINTAYGTSAITNLLMVPSRANYTMGGDSQTHINISTGGVGNSSIGDRSLQQCTFGSNNIAISTQSLASLTTGSNNCGIGTSALINYNGNQSVGIGYNSGFSLLSGDNNLFLGQYSGLNWATGASNVVMGDNAGGGSITSGSNNCFIGASTGTSVSSVSNSTCIGAGSQASGNNQIILGTSSETTYISGNLNLTGTFTGTINNIKTTSDNSATTCYIPFSKTTAGNSTALYLDDTTSPLTYTPSTSTLTATTFSGALSGNSTTSTNATNIISGTTNIQQQSQYVHSSFTLTTGTTLSISTPLYEIYPLAPTANLTITLPAASASLIGVRIQFRRTGGTTTTTITSASSNIYPNNSLTLSNSIMASGVYTAVIYCTYVTASTYAWYFA